MDPAVAVEAPAQPLVGDQGRVTGAFQWARVLAGGVLFLGVLVVTIREWRTVAETADEIGPAAIALSLMLAMCGLAASAVTWRFSLRELGATVSVPVALKVYLVGQLGKYIPGSLWALLIQMQMARAAGVKRVHSLGAGIVAVGINMVTGGALGLAVQPLVGGGSLLRYATAGVGVAVCAVLLTPPVLGRLAALGLRLARQPPLPRAPGWAGISIASGYSVASWLLYGVALSVLAIGAGADPSKTLFLALPAVALAMTIGFLVVLAPSGIGVREAVLVAALSPVLDHSTALGVALVLRFVFTLADLLAAAVTVPVRIGRGPVAWNLEAPTVPREQA
jgi:glycosyltransferase 2 family protein